MLGKISRRGAVSSLGNIRRFNALVHIGFIRIVAPKVAGSSPVGHPEGKPVGTGRAIANRLTRA